MSINENLIKKAARNMVLNEIPMNKKADK